MNQKFGSFYLALFLLAGASDVLAERLEQASISEAPWEFEIFGDAWLPKAPVTIVYNNFQMEGPENLNTILDSLRFPVVMMRIRAHKGPLGFFLEPIYYKGKYDEVTVIHLPTGEITDKAILRERVWRINYGISYEVGRWDFGKGEDTRVVTLEPYVGFRFVHDNIEIEVESEALPEELNKHITISTNSPIIGLRSHMQLKDDFGFLLEGDYGGFGVDKMEHTYLMAGYFDYKFKWKKFTSRAYIGYRFLHLDVQGGNATGGMTTINVNIQGPIFGMSLIF